MEVLNERSMISVSKSSATDYGEGVGIEFSNMAQSELDEGLSDNGNRRSKAISKGTRSMHDEYS